MWRIDAVGDGVTSVAISSSGEVLKSVTLAASVGPLATRTGESEGGRGRMGAETQVWRGSVCFVSRCATRFPHGTTADRTPTPTKNRNGIVIEPQGQQLVPFLVSLFVVLALITVFPALVTWLPQLVMGTMK